MQSASSLFCPPPLTCFAGQSQPICLTAAKDSLAANELLKSYFAVSPVFILLSDLTTMQYRYVSPSVRKVMGYADKVLMQHGPQFIHGRYHPEERDFQLFIQKSIGVFYERLQPKDKLNYLYGYLVKVKRSDGQYIQLMCQLQYLKTDEQCRPLCAVETFTDLTWLSDSGKRTLIIHKFSKRSGFSQFVFEYEIGGTKKGLTKREKEIQALVAQKYSSQEIGDKLFLSKHTVDSHRRNIRRKLMME